jgi:histidine kinase
MNPIRRKIGAKVFFAFLLVVFIYSVALMIALQFAAPTAFNRHMGGMGMGMGQGYGQGVMQGLYGDFRASVNEAVSVAAILALVVSLGASIAFSRRIVAPLQDMSAASRRIAQGKYDERVSIGSADELGQLAESFNEMAGELEQVEARRRQLIGDVSHELRTPLTAIKGSMEGLIDGLLPADPETFQQIHNEADRLNRLVDDLQELSRVEAHAYPLEFHDVDLSRVITTVNKRLSPNARSKSIILTSNIPHDFPSIKADEDRLIQILTNLISNAIQYSPEGGKVSISVEQRMDEIQICVADTGIGIPPEQLQNIFTRFFRLDKSRSRATGGGSGVGLTIARLLVEAHGGRIWVESDGEGKGSRFIFTLPVR